MIKKLKILVIIVCKWLIKDFYFKNSLANKLKIV